MLCVVRDALKVARSMSHKTQEDEVFRSDGKGRNCASRYKAIGTHGTRDTHDTDGGVYPRVSGEVRWCERHFFTYYEWGTFPDGLMYRFIGLGSFMKKR